ncbi:hypothetical protein N7462_010853 [Penicillium macrosclerotiorum]|uniref:uncharacterized protein n=1 Tax=Penicillium macrosclerotiorum TaxID=303699 RepID=UPI002547AAA1|nr:uncharacterized protein N7462_010853 [Penicillium macrosclerotiorum]KAJ5669783.1 hypothetical protein N7462_010853 [Penicillium macrosclerotiorum]
MSDSHETTSASSSDSTAKPDPAKNLQGGVGWGDRTYRKGGSEDLLNEGLGHVAAHNPRSTIGQFLGLQDQKTRAENKFLTRAELAAANVRPMNDHGEPTCDTEDHSFMGSKPGASDTLPGWDTVKNIFGR